MKNYNKKHTKSVYSMTKMSSFISRYKQCSKVCCMRWFNFGGDHASFHKIKNTLRRDQNVRLFGRHDGKRVLSSVPIRNNEGPQGRTISTSGLHLIINHCLSQDDFLVIILFLFTELIFSGLKEPGTLGESRNRGRSLGP